jgi:NADH:ubiquinone oxidoreductase subunit 2 (subunit N)
MVSFLKDRQSTEASLKYLLLGAIASAVLLLRYGVHLRHHRGDATISKSPRHHTASTAAGTITPALWLGIGSS